VDTLLSTRNVTTATLSLLNSLHTAFVLSSETEKNLVLGAVDVAYQNISALERAVYELRDKNASLGILNGLQERIGVLRDILYVETEKIWNKLVTFSEEGDIQMTIQKRVQRIFPPFLLCPLFLKVDMNSVCRGHYTFDFRCRGVAEDLKFIRVEYEESCLVTFSCISRSSLSKSSGMAIYLSKT
jgi:hypothetical protein